MYVSTPVNKAFITRLLAGRLSLLDHPEKVCANLILYEPARLPFGGKYIGMEAYRALVPQVAAYFDYERFELLGIFADEDMVFVTLNVGIKGSKSKLTLCEQFRFEDEKIAEIKIFVFD